MAGNKKDDKEVGRMTSCRSKRRQLLGNRGSHALNSIRSATLGGADDVCTLFDCCIRFRNEKPFSLASSSDFDTDIRNSHYAEYGAVPLGTRENRHGERSKPADPRCRLNTAADKDFNKDGGNPHFLWSQTPGNIINDNDPFIFKVMLYRVLVLRHYTSENVSKRYSVRKKEKSCFLDMRDAVNSTTKALSLLEDYEMKFGCDKSVLSLGLSKSFDSSVNNGELCLVQVNETMKYMKSFTWQMLFKRMGEDFVRWLLVECIVLVPEWLYSCSFYGEFDEHEENDAILMKKSRDFCGFRKPKEVISHDEEVFAEGSSLKKIRGGFFKEFIEKDEKILRKESGKGEKGAQEAEKDPNLNSEIANQKDEIFVSKKVNFDEKSGNFKMWRNSSQRRNVVRKVIKKRVEEKGVFRNRRKLIVCHHKGISYSKCRKSHRLQFSLSTNRFYEEKALDFGGNFEQEAHLHPLESDSNQILQEKRKKLLSSAAYIKGFDEEELDWEGDDEMEKAGKANEEEHDDHKDEDEDEDNNSNKTRGNNTNQNSSSNNNHADDTRATDRSKKSIKKGLLPFTTCCNFSASSKSFFSSLNSWECSSSSSLSFSFNANDSTIYSPFSSSVLSKSVFTEEPVSLLQPSSTTRAATHMSSISSKLEEQKAYNTSNISSSESSMSQEKVSSSSFRFPSDSVGFVGNFAFNQPSTSSSLILGSLIDPVRMQRLKNSLKFLDEVPHTAKLGKPSDVKVVLSELNKPQLVSAVRSFGASDDAINSLTFSSSTCLVSSLLRNRTAGSSACACSSFATSIGESAYVNSSSCVSSSSLNIFKDPEICSPSTFYSASSSVGFASCSTSFGFPYSDDLIPSSSVYHSSSSSFCDSSSSLVSHSSSSSSSIHVPSSSRIHILSSSQLSYDSSSSSSCFNLTESPNNSSKKQIPSHFNTEKRCSSSWKESKISEPLIHQWDTPSLELSKPSKDKNSLLNMLDNALASFLRSHDSRTHLAEMYVQCSGPPLTKKTLDCLQLRYSENRTFKEEIEDEKEFLAFPLRRSTSFLEVGSPGNGLNSKSGKTDGFQASIEGSRNNQFKGSLYQKHAGGKFWPKLYRQAYLWVPSRETLSEELAEASKGGFLEDYMNKKESSLHFRRATRSRRDRCFPQNNDEDRGRACRPTLKDEETILLSSKFSENACSSKREAARVRAHTRNAFSRRMKRMKKFSQGKTNDGFLVQMKTKPSNTDTKWSLISIPRYRMFYHSCSRRDGQIPKNSLIYCVKPSGLGSRVLLKHILFSRRFFKKPMSDTSRLKKNFLMLKSQQKKLKKYQSKIKSKKKGENEENYRHSSSFATFGEFHFSTGCPSAISWMSSDGWLFPALSPSSCASISSSSTSSSSSPMSFPSTSPSSSSSLSNKMLKKQVEVSNCAKTCITPDEIPQESLFKGKALLQAKGQKNTHRALKIRDSGWRFIKNSKECQNFEADGLKTALFLVKKELRKVNLSSSLGRRILPVFSNLLKNLNSVEKFNVKKMLLICCPPAPKMQLLNRFLSRNSGENPSISADSTEESLEPVLDLAIPHVQVVNFVFSLIRAVVPIELVGGKNNFELLMKRIEHFVLLNRKETFSVADLMHMMKSPKHGVWSDLQEKSSHSTHNNFRKKKFPEEGVCTPQKKKDLAVLKLNYLSRIVFFIFTHLVVPILRASFYITESEVYKHKVHFFHKPIWNAMQRREEALLASSSFAFEDGNSVFCSRSAAKRLKRRCRSSFPTKKKHFKKRLAGFTPTAIRWIPKRKKLRPLVDLSTKPSGSLLARGLLSSLSQKPESLFLPSATTKNAFMSSATLGDSQLTRLKPSKTPSMITPKNSHVPFSFSPNSSSLKACSDSAFVRYLKRKMSQKKRFRTHPRSTNELMQPVKNFLTFALLKNGEDLLGNSILSVDKALSHFKPWWKDVQRWLKRRKRREFSKKLKKKISEEGKLGSESRSVCVDGNLPEAALQSASNLGKIWFVKGDLSKCYESIKHEELIDVIKSIDLPESVDFLKIFRTVFPVPFTRASYGGMLDVAFSNEDPWKDPLKSVLRPTSKSLLSSSSINCNWEILQKPAISEEKSDSFPSDCHHVLTNPKNTPSDAHMQSQKIDLASPFLSEFSPKLTVEKACDVHSFKPVTITAFTTPESSQHSTSSSIFPRSDLPQNERDSGKTKTSRNHQRERDEKNSINTLRCSNRLHEKRGNRKAFSSSLLSSSMARSTSLRSQLTKNTDASSTIVISNLASNHTLYKQEALSSLEYFLNNHFVVFKALKPRAQRIYGQQLEGFQRARECDKIPDIPADSFNGGKCCLDMVENECATDTQGYKFPGLLIRLIDDFLFLSVDKKAAQTFLSLLVEEKIWGDNVNMQKLETNVWEFKEPKCSTSSSFSEEENSHITPALESTICRSFSSSRTASSSSACSEHPPNFSANFSSSSNFPQNPPNFSSLNVSQALKNKPHGCPCVSKDTSEALLPDSQNKRNISKEEEEVFASCDSISMLSAAAKNSVAMLGDDLSLRTDLHATRRHQNEDFEDVNGFIEVLHVSLDSRHHNDEQFQRLGSISRCNDNHELLLEEGEIVEDEETIEKVDLEERKPFDSTSKVASEVFRASKSILMQNPVFHHDFREDFEGEIGFPCKATCGAHLDFASGSKTTHKSDEFSNLGACRTEEIPLEIEWAGLRLQFDLASRKLNFDPHVWDHRSFVTVKDSFNLLKTPKRFHGSIKFGLEEHLLGYLKSKLGISLVDTTMNSVEHVLKTIYLAGCICMMKIQVAFFRLRHQFSGHINPRCISRLLFKLKQYLGSLLGCGWYSSSRQKSYGRCHQSKFFPLKKIISTQHLLSPQRKPVVTSEMKNFDVTQCAHKNLGSRSSEPSLKNRLITLQSTRNKQATAWISQNYLNSHFPSNFLQQRSGKSTLLRRTRRCSANSRQFFKPNRADTSINPAIRISMDPHLSTAVLPVLHAHSARGEKDTTPSNGRTTTIAGKTAPIGLPAHGLNFQSDTGSTDSCVEIPCRDFIPRSSKANSPSKIRMATGHTSTANTSLGSSMHLLPCKKVASSSRGSEIVQLSGKPFSLGVTNRNSSSTGDKQRSYHYYSVKTPGVSLSQPHSLTPCSWNREQQTFKDIHKNISSSSDNYFALLESRYRYKKRSSFPKVKSPCCTLIGSNHSEKPAPIPLLLSRQIDSACSCTKKSAFSSPTFLVGRQKVGLPQGSNISSLLVSLYFSKKDNNPKVQALLKNPTKRIQKESCIRAQASKKRSNKWKQAIKLLKAREVLPNSEAQFRKKVDLDLSTKGMLHISYPENRSDGALKKDATGCGSIKSAQFALHMNSIREGSPRVLQLDKQFFVLFTDGKNMNKIEYLGVFERMEQVRMQLKYPLNSVNTFPNRITSKICWNEVNELVLIAKPKVIRMHDTGKTENLALLAIGEPHGVGISIDSRGIPMRGLKDFSAANHTVSRLAITRLGCTLYITDLQGWFAKRISPIFPLLRRITSPYTVYTSKGLLISYEESFSLDRSDYGSSDIRAQVTCNIYSCTNYSKSIESKNFFSRNVKSFLNPGKLLFLDSEIVYPKEATADEFELLPLEDSCITTLTFPHPSTKEAAYSDIAVSSSDLEQQSSMIVHEISDGVKNQSNRAKQEKSVHGTINTDIEAIIKFFEFRWHAKSWRLRFARTVFNSALANSLNRKGLEGEMLSCEIGKLGEIYNETMRLVEADCVSIHSAFSQFHGQTGVRHWASFLPPPSLNRTTQTTCSVSKNPYMGRPIDRYLHSLREHLYKLPGLMSSKEDTLW